MSKYKSFFSKKFFMDTVALGAKIRNLRGEQSQSSFALRYGLIQKDISRLEKGEYKRPPYEFLLQLCEDYSIDLHWLLTGEEPERVVITKEDKDLIKAFHRLPKGKYRRAIQSLLGLPIDPQG